jgi:hypothetical protein
VTQASFFNRGRGNFIMHKIKGRVALPNAEIGGAGRMIAPTGLSPVATVRQERFTLPLAKTRLWLAGHSFTIASASDFGGAKIADLPNKNLALFAMALNAIGTITAPNVGTDLTLSLGTAVAAATPLASTAITYMTAKTGVGAAQSFTCVGHTHDGSVDTTGFGTGGTTPLLLDNGGANALFLNGAAAVASGTCTVSFSGGWVDVYYFDLDEPVALT